MKGSYNTLRPFIIEILRIILQSKFKMVQVTIVEAECSSYGISSLSGMLILFSIVPAILLCCVFQKEIRKFLFEFKDIIKGEEHKSILSDIKQMSFAIPGKNVKPSSTHHRPVSGESFVFTSPSFGNHRKIKEESERIKKEERERIKIKEETIKKSNEESERIMKLNEEKERIKNEEETIKKFNEDCERIKINDETIKLLNERIEKKIKEDTLNEEKERIKNEEEKKKRGRKENQRRKAYGA